MWCHLSGLAGYFVLFGSIIGPLLIWQLKRHEFPALDAHGKEAVNFHLSVLIYLVVGGALAVIGAFFCVGILLVPVLLVIPVLAIIFSVVAGVKASNGEMYHYPATIRLVK